MGLIIWFKVIPHRHGGEDSNGYFRVKVPFTSSLSVYAKVLAHNLNDIRNWPSLICW